MEESAANLSIALGYAGRGWAVFPCHSITQGHCTCSGWKTCADQGKHPRTKRGRDDATTDPDLIRRYWGQWPHANIGIATGHESGLAVIDSDPRHGGAEGLAQLEREHGPLPHTIETITGGDGRHLFFAYSAHETIKNSVGKLAPGVDVRGDGGYIIAPPSLHLAGKSYEWELAHHPEETTLATIPAWVMSCGHAATNGHHSPAFVTPEEIREGGRNDTLFRLGCSLRARGVSEVAIRAALIAENQERCVPPLADTEVAAIGVQVLKYEPGHPSQDKSEHVVIAPFIVSPKASPDSELFDGLRESDDRFRRTWEHRRKDLKTQAFEVYEYSLARQTRTAEWDIQEVVNLLIYHRRKYAAPQRDETYYRKILQKTAVESDKTDEESLDEADTQEALAKGDHALRAMLEDKLSIALENVIKRGKQNAVYSFLLKDGQEIALGPIETLMSPTKVKAKIYEVTLTAIKTYTVEQWRKIMNLFKPLMIEVDVGGERKELTIEWIANYLDKAERAPFPLALVDSDPFIEDGQVYLNVMSLRVYLNRNWMEAVEDKAIRARLSELGFLQKKKSGRIKGKVYSRNYWHTDYAFLGEEADSPVSE